MKGDTPQTIQLEQYQAPDYTVDNLALRFELEQERTLVHATIKFRQLNPAPLELNGQDLKLLSLTLNDQPLEEGEYIIDDDTLTIHRPPQAFTLETVCEIYPQKNLSLEGLYRSSDIFCTQCEAEGFRKITYFLDRPDVMTLYTVTIVADRDRYPVLLSNGNLVEQGELDNNRHWVTWQDPYKKPCYLFALVAGQLKHIEDSYHTTEGRDVTLRIFVEPENIDKCEHAMRSLKKAMQWDEERFGLAYDLDIYNIVAVNDFNMGAMENKSLNVFNSKYVLASPATATDSDYDGIESVIAHEYFHNWTGNRVTCRDWFQLSLKEGLTVFRDQEFSSDMTSRSVKRIQEVRILRTHQFAEDAGPMAHPVRPQSYVEINNFYTVTVYNKGAEVVRMYQSLFGRDGFRKGMDLYFKRHDGHAVTTDDFCAAMADANDYNLDQFKRWYDQAGTPEITVTDHYDAEQQTYTLSMTQHTQDSAGQTDKQPFYIPIVTGLLGADGTPLKLDIDGDVIAHDDKQMTLILKQAQQEFVFKGVTQSPVPSLLRDFSAPVKLRYHYTNEQLAFLMQHDVDDFNRWEAGQNLLLNQLQQLVDDVQTMAELKLQTVVIDALRQLLNDKQLDKGIVAEILSLPSEGYLADLQDGPVDVDAIHQAREFLKTAIANELHDELLACYHGNAQSGEYTFDAKSVAGRSLRNCALSYLAQLDNDASHQLCQQQFDQGDNMTDVFAALSCLSNLGGENRDRAMDDFYQHWQHDALVMDKWFSLQARSRAEDTLERVKALLHHEAFSISNPNKVRALVGSFASANPVHFHRQDGAGYQLVSDIILQLDPVNPQVAARLLQAFTQWRRYQHERKALMREQLERILQTEELSRDCYEIANKCLTA